MSDRANLRRLGPVDVVGLLVPEREALTRLLQGLTADDWNRPTECPAWTVRGVALHVLGDDLSLLARQRDAEMPSLFTEASLPTWDGAPPAVLDRFNERWVHAATFLSPALLVELLRMTGETTHAWYTTVDPDSIGEPVMLFGMDAAPYRAIAAREYLERWVHHLQIRRALDLDPGPLGAPPLVDAAVEVVARAIATLAAFVMPSTEQTMTVELGSQTFTFVHDDGADAPHGWEPRAGGDADAAVTVSVAPEDVVVLVSRGLGRAEATAALRVTAGEAELGRSVVAGMAAAMSAYYVEI